MFSRGNHQGHLPSGVFLADLESDRVRLLCRARRFIVGSSKPPGPRPRLAALSVNALEALFDLRAPADLDARLAGIARADHLRTTCYCILI